eukprot:g21830.t1
MLNFFKQKQETQSELRAKQIDALFAYNPSTKQLDQARTSFELTVNTKYGQLPFRIILGPQFPVEAPQISLPTPVLHPWVDRNYNVIGHPSLQHWAPRNHLGRIAKEIHDEFYVNPPTPHYTQPAPLLTPTPTSQPSQPLGGLNGFPQQQPPQEVAKPPPPKTQPPKIPDSFPELQTLSELELAELARGGDSLADFALTVQSCKDLFAVRTELYNNAKLAAQANLAREPEVNQLQQEVEALRGKVQEQQQQWEQLTLRKQTVAQKYSMATVLAALQRAAQQAEQEADALRDTFKEQSEGESAEEDDDPDSEEKGDEESGRNKKKKPQKKSKKLTPSQFSAKYVKVRKRMHEYSATRERLKEAAKQSTSSGLPDSLIRFPSNTNHFLFHFQRSFILLASSI